jgi:hypothetical protein
MDLPRIEARMLRWMVALAILGMIAILATWRFQVALAFVIGAAFGVVNFHWLWQTGKVLMEAQTARVPRMRILLIILRYLLSFVGLFILFYTRWLSPLPVITGMLIPISGVLMESLLLVYADLRGKQTA